MPFLILLAVVTLALLWYVGEAADKPILRRIAAPLLMALVAVIAYGAATVQTSFESSRHYSGATKEFVSALISAIDRGDAQAAHDELRRFDSVAIETYEGGMFLHWMEESVTRLSTDATTESGQTLSPNENAAAPPSADDGERE